MMENSTHTPQHAATTRAVGITQAQRQALVDNLQQEITQRARKLRGQYALQAQALRSRLEMRVNRIPQAMRKRNIQELVDDHHAKTRPAPPPPVPVLAKSTAAPTVQPAEVQPKQTLKRKSDQMSTSDDKENVPAQPAPELPNPKKRTKTAMATANTKATRARNAGPSGVLSPKSHNSRTFPQSPIKAAEKPQSTRTLHSAQVAAAKPRTASRQTKRPGTASDTEGRTSEASTTSAGTTVVTKPSTRKAAVPKKAAATKAGTVGRKVTATKTEAAIPAAATRTLRKRN